ncbi:MAG: F0F1 ATP synthase subunit delta [Spirochaetia bacterium]|jgi:F-type H+-transporting ATPase subunit b|nr:F0F1 ATP synthase subunit delta [Spirochaetia bacterium]
MSVDWFTVIAQILNFVVLVLLLKKFLYKPVLTAIAAREKLIADEIADAKEKMAQADKERNEFQLKNDEFDKTKSALLENAKKEADAERVRLIEEAQKSSDEMKANYRAGLEADAKNLNLEITGRAQQEVFAISRKVLADLSTISLEASLFDLFLQRLRALEEPAKKIFFKAFTTASEPVLVRSAFDLTVKQQEAIQKALNETFEDEIKVTFKVETELLGGIELASNGQKLAWNIADYLKSMERMVGDTLGKKTNAESIKGESRNERP